MRILSHTGGADSGHSWLVFLRTLPIFNLIRRHCAEGRSDSQKYNFSKQLENCENVVKL